MERFWKIRNSEKNGNSWKNNFWNSERLTIPIQIIFNYSYSNHWKTPEEISSKPFYMLFLGIIERQLINFFWRIFMKFLKNLSMFPWKYSWMEWGGWSKSCANLCQNPREFNAELVEPLNIFVFESFMFEWQIVPTNETK